MSREIDASPKMPVPVFLVVVVVVYTTEYKKNPSQVVEVANAPLVVARARTTKNQRLEIL